MTDTADDPFAPLLEEYAARRDKALAMGGPEKLAKRKEQGVLNARERLDYLLDPGSFVESGLFATSHRPEVREKSAADGKVAGFGTIDGRKVAVISNDFTVLGASSSVINGKKMKHIKDIANARGLPLVFLGESTGARMPDRMGAPGRAILGQDPFEYRRDRTVPWASGLMGDCYGSSTWYGVMADFAVMRKGATMAVASSRVTSIAISQPVDPEDLGGWKLHTGTTGLVDYAVDTDEAVMDLLKQFLAYLPSHQGLPAPRLDAPADAGEAAKDIMKVVPPERQKVYDTRKVIATLADPDSLFELKPRFGKSMVTALCRFAGRSVGVIANNPIAKGGAIDIDAMRKATSFLVLCDSFNIPILFLVDQPGFLIGLESERRAAPGMIMNWMNALSLVTVPKICITLRKNYGQAYLNMGGGKTADAVAAWPTADFGFMDPATGVNVLYGVTKDDDPERFAQLVEEISQDNSAYALASLYEAHHVLDPRETRPWILEMLSVFCDGAGQGIGEHRLSCWPTTY